jgi:hypothetical protein
MPCRSSHYFIDDEGKYRRDAAVFWRRYQERDYVIHVGWESKILWVGHGIETHLIDDENLVVKMDYNGKEGDINANNVAKKLPLLLTFS